ncbi:MAG: hypothetical protein H7844_09445 [Nitrospirae bacterium YQR-1]
MSLIYEVVPYRVDELCKLLCNSCFASASEITSKLHIVYFAEYFDYIKAKTIVVEYEYIDRDFLEDYARYYVKCFKDYKRKCKRLHFFKEPFSQSDFTIFLQEPSDSFREKLNDSYLGFIVVKPLPRTVIGRTCLTTYSDDKRRKFPSTRRYTINLFGIALSVETLAYQEQDSVAAACATSALWSIFQKTGRIFHHHIPTPIEITETATSNLPTQSRSLPNDGLNIEQMAVAIRNVGLEPLFVSVDNEYTLKSTMYSYLKGGIPLAFVVRLVDTSSKPNKYYSSDLHAVAISGYSIGKPSPTPHTGFLTIASQMDKIYVHDDQVGPFARMIIDGINVEIDIGDNKTGSYYSISSSWRGKNKKVGSVRALPFAVLIPLYHKIRIPYSFIETIIMNFDFFVEYLRNEKYFSHSERLKWDIFLSTSNDFKRLILQEGLLKGIYLKDVLTCQMPRFIWRALAYIGDAPAIELIFDATDIEQGALLITIIKYDKMFYNRIKTIVTQTTVNDIMLNTQLRVIAMWFNKNP